MISQEEDKEEDDRYKEGTPCAKRPCGAHAICWNSGSRFMCTCDHEHPHGNPYFGCHVCVYDSDCKGEDAFCRNKTECAYRQPAGGKGEVPEGYRRIGTGRHVFLLSLSMVYKGHRGHFDLI